jgi:hypothetical protein
MANARRWPASVNVWSVITPQASQASQPADHASAAHRRDQRKVRAPSSAISA